MGMVIFSFVWDESYFGNRGAPFAITQPMMLVFTMFMLVATMLETTQKTVQREVQLAQRVERQEAELLETRIDIMLSQMQPHFLYNTLTTIETFCYKDSKTAAKLVREFSVYLRENMDSLTQKELVSFKREFEHVKIYLDIEKLRFEERLNIIYDFEVTDFKLPILTIQPLVENAVRYGVNKKLSGGTVTIATRLVAEGVKIIISDDGEGFEPSQTNCQDGRSHVGVENVRERLRAQCGGTLTVESEKDKGTICTIIIPKGNET
jgi:LytS/YehU family sensor histidine kinase